MECHMQFSSLPIPEHQEVPLADDGRWEALIEQWTPQDKVDHDLHGTEKAVYVLSVGRERDPRIRQAQLAEIVGLVQAQGDRVVGQEIYILNKPNARTFLGKGTSRAVAQRARELGATMVVLDAGLSPSQARNLEDFADIAICDREAVILNVFLRNAKTRRARTQVEIAQLEYLRPRIRGLGLDMDQQMGGVAGNRGAGETASELMARKLDGRLVELRRVQEKLKRAEARQRERRADCHRIVMVGYTNAGKTTLMNQLTSETLSAKDQPFETLDTTSRSLSRYGGEVILSDTVGFIRDLPQSLLSSFESTLAEVVEASLIVIVVDVTDFEWREHLVTTEAQIEALGAADIARFYVFNKADLLDAPVPECVFTDIVGESAWYLLSGLDLEAVERLREELLNTVREGDAHATIVVPYRQSSVLSMIYKHCRVRDPVSLDLGLEMSIEGPAHVVAQIEQKLEILS